ncbi:hypothetical protein ABW21_db0205214 [Orbilia brochopaga]|nr:hypothetical protein ABW21_db0205214 [Drechslerella brochopaga]
MKTTPFWKHAAACILAYLISGTQAAPAPADVETTIAKRASSVIEGYYPILLNQDGAVPGDQYLLAFSTPYNDGTWQPNGYDDAVQQCAGRCTADTNCKFWNLYATDYNGGDTRCALFSSGHYRLGNIDFYRTPEFTISRSIGYRKKPVFADFVQISFGDAAISAPSGTSTYRGYSADYTTAQACVDSCIKKWQGNADRRSASTPNQYYPCSFVNYYDKYVNGQLVQNICAYYSVEYGQDRALNKGNQNKNSFGYALRPASGDPNNNGVVTLY